jgi:hypothetical protein
MAVEFWIATADGVHRLRQLLRDMLQFFARHPVGICVLVLHYDHVTNEADVLVSRLLALVAPSQTQRLVVFWRLTKMESLSLIAAPTAVVLSTWDDAEREDWKELRWRFPDTRIIRTRFARAPEHFDPETLPPTDCDCCTALMTHLHLIQHWTRWPRDVCLLMLSYVLCADYAATAPPSPLTPPPAAATTSKPREAMCARISGRADRN